MLSKEEIEELDDEYCEVEPDTTFNLDWSCKECEEDNTEYNIPIAKEIICECSNCGKKYKYCYDPY